MRSDLWMRGVRTAVVSLTVALFAACGGGGGEDGSAAGGSSTSATAATGAEAPDPGRVLALGEERLLADLLALGIRPVASTANVVIDGGFVGLDGMVTDDIEALVSTEPNLEELAALQPDVVVANEFFADRIGREVLEAMGTLVVVPNGEATEQLLALGDAFDRSTQAEVLVAELDAAIIAAQEILADLPEDARTVSVATVYPGPSVAAWVDGPVDIPSMLIKLGFTLRPSADVRGAEGGRVYLSPEQLGILDAGTIVAMQTEHVEGEAAAIEEIARDPLWSNLPAVVADRIVTIDRLGYPGMAGQIRLVEDLVQLLGP